MSDESLQIAFLIDPYKKGQFVAKLLNDEFRKTKFFNMLVDRYLENDERMMSLVEDWRKANVRFNKKRREVYLKQVEKGKQLVLDFSLDDEEKDEIFNIIGDI
jgi:hypothetical protein